MRRIVINGANGYVGSHFACQLLKEGFQVVALVRSRKTASASERMETALRKIGCEKLLGVDRLEIYAYKLLSENLDLSNDSLNKIFDGKVDYFHFAANLKYDARSHDEIFAANLDGLRHSIEVFRRFHSPSSRFFFISSAYSSGVIQQTFKEEFYPNQEISHFRNYYEQSKRFGENLLYDYKIKNLFPAHIIRLSQVVGDNQTGITDTHYGIFDFVKKVYQISKQFPNENIRVNVNPEATQNLIPIDTVIYYLMASVIRDDLPSVMNFVSNYPIENKIILGIINDILPVKLLSVPGMKKEEMTVPERIVYSGMSFTGSYINTKLTFETTQRDRLVFIHPHEITYDTLRSMLNYYVTHHASQMK